MNIYLMIAKHNFKMRVDNNNADDDKEEKNKANSNEPKKNNVGKTVL